MGGPDLNLLVPLRALLEEANLTRAGERVNLGQSSMSSALARLRGVFNDELLVRVGREYELTPFARSLLPQVQQLVPKMERLLDAGVGLDPARAQRTLTMMVTDYGVMRLNTAIADVLADAPGMSVRLLPLPHQPMDSERDLMTHDFVVTVPGTGIEGPHVALTEDEYVCLLDAGNPAVREGRLAMADFIALPQAVARFGQHHYTPAERRLRELGIDRREPRVTTTSFMALPSVVAGTDLVAVMPRALATALAPVTGTVVVDAPFGRVPIALTLWWHASHEHDPVHAWFRRRLTAAVAVRVTAT